MLRSWTPGRLICSAGLLSLFFAGNLTRADPGIADGPNLGPGALLLKGIAASHWAPRLDTRIGIRVEGIAARVTVTQAFFNGSSDWVDGVYVFPLPDESAVDQLELNVGERRIVGEIAERESAQATYERARAAGNKATLVEQERPNLFTSSIANIGPGETVQVVIGYWLKPRYEGGSFSLTLPMTLTPRYIPGAPDGGVPAGLGWSANTDPVGDASRITPPVSLAASTDSHRFAIEAAIQAGFQLRAIVSASHQIQTEDLGSHYRVTLSTNPAPMDRDFELTWHLRPSDHPEVAIFTEQFQGSTHALLLALPPVGDASRQPATPRELILVVDTSGSMHGLAMNGAKRALAVALDGLDPQDSFNVIRFSNVTRRLFPEPVAADSAHLARARRYLGSLNAEGGTEMAAALLTAFQQPSDPTRLRQVVFITDGSVGNETELFGIIKQRLGTGRLFTIGLGAAPNGWFMRKAAEFGRGDFTSIPTIAEVVPRMTVLLSKLRSPQVTELSVDWPVDGAEVFPRRLPDLYAGQPLVLLARLDASSGLVTLAGQSGGGYWLRQQEFPEQASPGVARLWARAKVESILDGRGRAAPPDVRDEVLATALGYGVLTPFTALVAVDKSPARPVHLDSAQHAVPVLLPEGQSSQAIFGFPQTAAGLWLRMLLGAIVMAVSAGLFWTATWGVVPR